MLSQFFIYFFVKAWWFNDHEDVKLLLINSPLLDCSNCIHVIICLIIITNFLYFMKCYLCVTNVFVISVMIVICAYAPLWDQIGLLKNFDFFLYTRFFQTNVAISVKHWLNDLEFLEGILEIIGAVFPPHMIFFKIVYSFRFFSRATWPILV